MQQRRTFEKHVFSQNHKNDTGKRDSLSVVHMHSTDSTSLEHGKLLEQKLHYTCIKEGNWKNKFFSKNHINVTRKHDSLSVVHMHSTDSTS